MEDRHARHRRPDADRRRRPSDGHRARDRARFRRLVSDATAALPPLVRAHLQGVEVAIGDVPDDGSDRRFSRYETGLAGDRLTLYRRPLELRAYSRNDLVELIRETLTRQVADHLGLDEDGIDEW